MHNRLGLMLLAGVLLAGLISMPVAAVDSTSEEKADSTSKQGVRVLGLWASDHSLFELIEDEGRLLGIIRVITNPTYTQEEAPARVGELRKDDQNPEPAKRNRPLVGISILSEYEYKKGLWRGKIYDPDTGKTYKSRISLTPDGRLKIRGYIGSPVFGQSAYFHRAETCQPYIMAMLGTLADERCLDNE